MTTPDLDALLAYIEELECLVEALEQENKDLKAQLNQLEIFAAMDNAREDESEDA